MIVTDDSKTACNTASDVLKVRVNHPPVAVAGGDREAYAGGANNAILFDGTKSYDPDNEPLTFYWDFGDGVKTQGSKATHFYKKPGRYTVTLRVNDGNGLKSSVAEDMITVTVK